MNMKHRKVPFLALSLVFLLLLSACSFGKKPTEQDKEPWTEAAGEADQTDSTDLPAAPAGSSGENELPIDSLSEAENQPADGDGEGSASDNETSGDSNGESVDIGESSSIELPPVSINDLQP